MLQVKLPRVRCMNDGCRYYKKKGERFVWIPRAEVITFCPVCKRENLEEVREKRRFF